ncbi:hypothetical protein [Acetobacter garciniae]|uniref:Uncharacterized protein n=2 Tax=Acetobacter garciniae TaxID=2817435 RepID=A0A939KR45_9PROT|nr:hypothetical protein [Acetobacter garciniae]MBO1326292.1 hypothetical protein [Acetobacter garciniae]
MNGLPQALSQAIANANAWQQRAEMYRQDSDKWEGRAYEALDGWKKEEARTAQLRTELKAAQQQAEANRANRDEWKAWGTQTRDGLKQMSDKWKTWGEQTRDSLEQVIAQRDARIAQLEAELKAARGA